MSYHLAVEICFTSAEDSTDEHFEAFLDEMLASLEQIGRDVNLSARFAERVADVAGVVAAPDFESAVSAFLADLRTALHAAGCSTAGWPRFEPVSRTVRQLQDA